MNFATGFVKSLSVEYPTCDSGVPAVNTDPRLIAMSAVTVAANSGLSG
jgi:hypothetical protein